MKSSLHGFTEFVFVSQELKRYFAKAVKGRKNKKIYPIRVFHFQHVYSWVADSRHASICNESFV